MLATDPTPCPEEGLELAPSSIDTLCGDHSQLAFNALLPGKFTLVVIHLGVEDIEFLADRRLAINLPIARPRGAASVGRTPIRVPSSIQELATLTFPWSPKTPYLD